MADYELILSRLEGVRRSGDKAMAFCPAHSDMSQSLSVRLVREGAQEKLLLHCFAGCGALAVLTSIGLSWDAVMPEAGEYRQSFYRSKSEKVESAEALLELVPHWVKAGRKFSAKDKADIIEAKLLVLRAKS
ncbi:hypothetical protein N9K75_00460 [bacterium]|nr:hypothetical protein [bacterium]